jgi:putative transposase
VVHTSTAVPAAPDQKRSRAGNGPRRHSFAGHAQWPAVRAAGDKDSERQRRDPDDGQYAGPSFGGAEQVFRYLGRYSHRVAISNSRLLACADGHVSFSWKDYADGHRAKVMRLTVDEFIRRFLLHVLPKRFVRIRHYGLLAGRQVATKLVRCRELLGVSTVQPQATVRTRTTCLEQLAASLQDPRYCPRCHGPLTHRPLEAPTATLPGSSGAGTPLEPQQQMASSSRSDTS